MAFSEIYVDSAATGANDGSSPADAFTDLEAGIVATTFDTTNGTRVNIKGTQTLTADLQVSIDDAVTTPAWVPSKTAPLIFQGYTAAADDGGLCEISGGGSVGILNKNTLDYVFFVDCHLTNTGANIAVDLDNDCGAFFCKFSNINETAWQSDNGAQIVGCYFTDISGNGINIVSYGLVANSYFEDGSTYTFNGGMNLSNINCLVQFNIIDIGGAAGSAFGINIADGCTAQFNSIYGAASNDTGIRVIASEIGAFVINNLIEGFTASGGIGIDLNQANSGAIACFGNSIYDCDTNIAGPAAYQVVTQLANETLTVSPFTDATNGDFTPVETGLTRTPYPTKIGGGLV